MVSSRPFFEKIFLHFFKKMHVQSVREDSCFWGQKKRTTRHLFSTDSKNELATAPFFTV